MHARVAQYTFRPGQGREVARRAEKGMLPIFQQRHGFRGYWVVLTDHDTGYSVSVWDSPAEATDAIQAAAKWVEENVADMIVSVQNHVGELAFARMARNTID